MTHLVKSREGPRLELELARTYVYQAQQDPAGRTVGRAEVEESVRAPQSTQESAIWHVAAGGDWKRTPDAA